MKKFLNRRNGVLLAAVLVAVAFFSFKSGDDRNFQIAKNLDTFNSIVKELDMFYVDTLDPNKTVREGIDYMSVFARSLYGILSGGRSGRTAANVECLVRRYRIFDHVQSKAETFDDSRTV